MEKVRRFAVFLLLPLHLILTYSDGEATFFLFMAVLSLIADLMLSGWQISLFSAKWEGVPSFFADFSVYFVKKLLLAAVELVIYLIAVGSFGINILNDDWGKELFFWICVLEMLLSAVIVLVIGTIRAALHRK